MESNTSKVTKQAARRAVAGMQCPEGVSRVTWTGVRAVLEAIAACYPNAYPSQVTLAARTGIPERSIQRYTAVAVKAGLLLVKPNAGAEPRSSHGARTNRYLLAPKLLVQPAKKVPSELLVQAATLAYQENTYSVGVPETSSLRTTSSDPKSARPPSGRASRRDQPTPTVTRMRDWQEDHGRQVNPDAPAASRLRPSKRVGRQRDDPEGFTQRANTKGYIKKRLRQPDPEWMRLAKYFDVLWEQMKLDSQQYKGVRGADSYNQCKYYIEAHFGNRSEVEVRKLMQAFVISVSQGHITLKPGQSGWRCFTGAWGRQSQAQQQEQDIYADLRRRLAEGKSG